MRSIVPAGGGPAICSVSVLLATHGRPQTLRRALDSLAAQTLEADRFETVVIINGPPSGSAEVVADFRHDHPSAQVRVIETATPGVAHARTLGLWAARGEYVTIVDDDDWVSPGFLDQLVSHVSPGVVPLAWLAEMHDDAPGEPSFDTYLSRRMDRLRGRTVPAQDLREGISLNVCKLVPTGAARAVGYDFGLRSGSDFVFWTKLYARDQFRFHVLEEREAVYYRTLGAGSLSRQGASFDFSVTQRLACISSLESISPDSRDVEQMVAHMVTAQCRHINRHLRAQPEDRAAVLDAAGRLSLTRLDWGTVNRGLSRHLALAPGLLSGDAAQALLPARRIRQRGIVVDLVCRRSPPGQIRDAGWAGLADPWLGNRRLLDPPTTEMDWPTASAYVRGVLRTVEGWAAAGATYDGVTSYAPGTISHVAAALCKLRTPGIQWTADLAEAPGAVGAPETRMQQGPIREQLRTALLDAGFAAPADSLADWATLAVFALADEIVFGSQEQRARALRRLVGDEALTARVQRLSTIMVDLPVGPRPAPDPVAQEPPRLDPARMHLAMPDPAPEGVPPEICDALSALPGHQRERVQVHLFTERREETAAQVWRAGLADVISVEHQPAHAALLERLRVHDVLLVADPEGDPGEPGTGLPLRLVECSSSGRPVWALVGEDTALTHADVAHRSARGDVGATSTMLHDLLMNYRAAQQRGEQ